MYDFDPSTTELTIAGYAMQDFTSLSIVNNDRRRSVQGVDPTYHTYEDLPTFSEITVSVLASCPDLEFMDGLEKALSRMKGYFEVSITSNGRFIGIYDCYFKNDSNESFTDDANDKVFDMVAVKQDDAIFSNRELGE